MNYERPYQIGCRAGVSCAESDGENCDDDRRLEAWNGLEHS